jgi:formylglycine-generating enzyme required for sulfatase activity
VGASSVAGFLLDRYEVTVARFEAFLADYDAFRARGEPAARAGAHPLIGGTGWHIEWALPSDARTLRADRQYCNTIPFATTMPTQPVNCVTWYEAQAFCIWDGGRLPTELEWEYAAAGGDDNRTYPWGHEPPTPERASYNCTGTPEAPCEPLVGSYPAGQSRWEQLDMAGSVMEWTFDAYSTMERPPPCHNCAEVTQSYAPNPRTTRGGGYASGADQLRVIWRDHGLENNIRVPQQGFRCAYNMPE